MAYSGYLIKVGNYVVPNSFIKLESYEIYPDRRQDLDSYRDGNGKLHRTVVKNRPSTIKFTLKALRLADQQTFISNVKANYTNEAQRKVSVKFYNPESNGYETKDMYFPDIPWTIYSVDDSRNDIMYNPTDIELIGY